MTLEWTPDPAGAGDWIATGTRPSGEVLRYCVYETAPGQYRALLTGSKEKVLARRRSLDDAKAACQRHDREG